MFALLLCRRLLSFDPGSRLVLALALGAIAILWAFVLESVHHLETEARDRLREDAEQMVELIEGESAGAFDVAISVLDRAVDSLEHDDPVERFKRILKDLQRTHPEITAIASIGADGNGEIVMGGIMRPYNASDHESYLHHRDDASSEPYFSLPFVGSASHQRRIAISRRISASGGRLARIIAVTVDYASIQKMLIDARIGRHGTVSLHRNDRVLLATGADDGISRPGRSTAASTVWRHLETADEGVFEVAQSHVDGTARVVAFRRMRNLPMVAVVTVATKDIAARTNDMVFSHYRAASVASVALAAFGLAGMYATGRLHRLRRISEIRRIAADRARRRAELANLAKSRFLAHMSHELRTPLNAVMGFAETIRGGYVEPVGPRTREYADNIAESGEKLLVLVDELLDATDMEASDTPLALEAVDLRSVVDVAAARLSFEFAQRRVALETGGAIDGPVRVNRRALQRALTSLLANAVRFAPVDGQVRVDVARTDAILEIRIADNGPGLPPEMAARIGEPFMQSDNPMTAAKSGAGVGLWVVKSLVERQGGRLSAEPAPAGGTIIVLRFPALGGANTAAA